MPNGRQLEFAVTYGLTPDSQIPFLFSRFLWLRQSFSVTIQGIVEAGEKSMFALRVAVLRLIR